MDTIDARGKFSIGSIGAKGVRDVYSALHEGEWQKMGAFRQGRVQC